MLFSNGKHPVYSDDMNLEEYNNVIEQWNFSINYP